MTSQDSKPVAVVGNNLPSKLEDTFDPASLQDWHKTVETDQKLLMKIALFVLIGIFGIGGIWSAVAPIGQAVIASGRIVAEGRNRVIQHLEGGIIDEIYVREGDQVKKGDPLALLDATQTGAQLENFKIQRAILLVQLARRRAEVSNSETIEFPTNFEKDVLTHPKVQETIQNQQTEFNALRAVGEAEVVLLNSNIAAEEADLESNAVTLASFQKQLAFAREELSGIQELYEKGYAPKSDLLRLQRQEEDIKRRIEEVEFINERTRQAIIGFQNQIKQVGLNYNRDAAAQIVDLQVTLNETEQNITRLEDIATRGLITAPVDGTVFGIATTTLGAVLRPGDTLFEMFPDGEGLRIEARVQIKDIELVSEGQDADIVFPSNRGQADAPVKGKVTYLSRTSVVTEQNPEGFYIAHVSLDLSDVDQLILPGNSAEVYLKTEERTFLQIVTEPISRFAFKAFKG
ncbi:HlyD family type I secretion periplasmic adaptor subunit [Kordiimonas sp. SCSIO 12610]|uniref:HlyD family type I secretion periplasmic adaptor subunit n=1 Tax=Kordiimonas sp. SCSIO 12610 TaxID=2829597 RepID=UPI00210B66C8|nr:HlyD family type I secretion periplasmic adaptor subunit [Kordiimonas sp. SCSIO 12610]UTW56263.1 HlyD family type I secretion periplasmic adaptor subunit [Kordiimonas sp. SCSIO 12610]